MTKASRTILLLVVALLLASSAAELDEKWTSALSQASSRESKLAAWAAAWRQVLRTGEDSIPPTEAYRQKLIQRLEREQGQNQSQAAGDDAIEDDLDDYDCAVGDNSNPFSGDAVDAAESVVMAASCLVVLPWVVYKLSKPWGKRRRPN